MLKQNIFSTLNWTKINGLIPVIIQHKISGQILMHAYMNKKSLKITLKTKKATFFSRTKNKIWTKGETTGNFLYIKKITTDCDKDTLLILVEPVNKTCHLNEYSCFKNTISDFTFLYLLENILNKKKNSIKSSYTNQLYQSGLKRITQKVGEEAIETIIAANDNNKKETMQETADLIYHLIVLLKIKNINLYEIIKILKKRNS
ncbi:bifunctional phosphoribosyl-AMP cyclohydrolase/phosphoribosyl-ATP diphosphatase HisIE [Enterobacteriaceae endosymbiont of Donacia bicoloricornis]|uniref:bifunctional phosphoribosyl-AMP cyclohydrolase/phosphoribosyl-ATP diphosphatase HisIE n=1 Tax=Enterobacteriaceae endosymbiont of Donacia bicoloricornis TaxID=2675772 RepID=UPI0014495FBF|nr:bifunctional phosphoribosyl-AMP cyclohydrolase/phosphoribosyl-ATP diphosphatase HisIE [Enterobacteriaceae endosymbiont of Donacia bicoloricornis]QJC37655.1 bifunctional phosphoribosyl-AMP cyclohydrolase/phosphoribosyl-ATP diphosphatase HisIE [Enterobacteriaceae endosymbiont of Donacia bicoloricornis]